MVERLSGILIILQKYGGILNIPISSEYSATTLGRKLHAFLELDLEGNMNHSLNIFFKAEAYLWVLWVLCILQKL